MKRKSKSEKRYAVKLFNKGRFDEARKLLLALCSADRTDVDSWLMLARIHLHFKNYTDCEQCCQQILLAKPEHTKTFVVLGNALECQNRPQEAFICYQKSVSIEPAQFEPYYFMGNVACTLGHPGQAIDFYRMALHNNPRHFESLNNLGCELRKKGRIKEALVYLDQAMKLKSGSAVLLHNVGSIHLSLARPDDAVRIFRKAVSVDPQPFTSHLLLANAYAHKNDLDEALTEYARALKIRPNSPDACAGKASVHERRGEFSVAYELIQPFIANDKINSSITKVFLTLASHVDAVNEALDSGNKLLAYNDIDDWTRVDCHYEVGKLYDEAGKYNKAFEHYHLGNVISRKVNADIIDAAPDKHDEALAKNTLGSRAELWSNLPKSPVKSEQPVFIVGMPRSGTTLAEQILSSHPDVHGAGELKTIFQIAHSIADKHSQEMPYPLCLPALNVEDLSGYTERYLKTLAADCSTATRIIDKKPGNFLHLGLISVLFPEARIIHMMRDPVDTCLSIYFQKFSPAFPFASDLADTGNYYRQYIQLMNHWKRVLNIPILDVQYEELVSDQETVSRKMVAFCGLEWDAQCLRFYDTQRDVNTPSYRQVRKPIYQGSVGRWKHYENHIGPLLTALKGQST